MTAVIEILAVAGSLPLGLLEGLVPHDDLDAAESHDLVRSERSGAQVECRLAHPLFGEVLRAGSSPRVGCATWPAGSPRPSTETRAAGTEDVVAYVTFALDAGDVPDRPAGLLAARSASTPATHPGRTLRPGRCRQRP